MNADAKTAFQVTAAPPPELPSIDVDPPDAELVRMLADWLSRNEEAPQGLATRTIQLCFDRSD